MNTYNKDDKWKGQVQKNLPGPVPIYPLDVPGVDTDIKRDEIVDIIREIRELKYP